MIDVILLVLVIILGTGTVFSLEFDRRKAVRKKKNGDHVSAKEEHDL